MSTARIPAITNKRILDLLTRIKPVIIFEDGPQYIAPVAPRTMSFTWNPQPAGSADGLVEIGQIPTFHTWTYYGFFKPTIAEVLAQIPEVLLATTVAFSTKPDTSKNMYGLTEDEKHQTGTTTLYGKA